MSYLQNQATNRELLPAFAYLWAVWQALSKLPYGSYLIIWWRNLWRILLGTVLITGGVGLWLAFEPDEYLAELQFVPPMLEELNAFPYPRVVPGAPTDLERMLSFLESPTFLYQIADSFDLVKHYRLDQIRDPKKRAKRLTSALQRNIRARITRNSTLHLQIYDEDPTYAYRIAQFALRKVQEQVAFYDRNSLAYADAQQQEQEVEKEIAQIQTRLAELRQKYKIISGLSLSLEEASLQYLLQMMQRNPESFAHYDEAVTLEIRLRSLTRQKVELQRRRMDREMFQRAGQNPIWVIQSPMLPAFPDRPKRFSILLLTFFGSFAILSLLVIYAHYVGLLSLTVRDTALTSVQA